MWGAARAVFARDLRLAWVGGGAASPIGFFVGATLLAPLSLGGGALAAVGPPLLWVSAALAALMTLERLFQADLEDGSFDQLLLAEAPLELLVLAKGAAAWVAVGAPLALAAGPLALALQATPAAAALTMAGVAIGMAAFLGVGLIGAALAAGVRRGGLLIAVLVLPFYAPPVIFGAAATAAAARGADPAPALLLLAGCAVLAGALAPIAAAAAARLQAE